MVNEQYQHHPFSASFLLRNLFHLHDQRMPHRRADVLLVVWFRITSSSAQTCMSFKLSQWHGREPTYSHLFIKPSEIDVNNNDHDWSPHLSDPVPQVKAAHDLTASGLFTWVIVSVSSRCVTGCPCQMGCHYDVWLSGAKVKREFLSHFMMQYVLLL